LRRGLQRGFAVAALVLLVVLAIAAKLLQPESAAPEGSVDSAEPSGRKALLLLLRGVGFDAEAWRDAPAVLPREHALLWLPCVPPRSGPVDVTRASPDRKKSQKEPEKEPKKEKSEKEPPPDVVSSPARTGAFGLAHYGEFVRAGGVLVVAAGQETKRFLVEDLGIPVSAIPPAAEDAPAGVRAFEDASGGRLAVDVRKNGVLAPGSAGSVSRSIVRTHDREGYDEDILAAAIPLGTGKVVLLGDDAFLANEKIGQNDHALFAVDLARALAPSSAKGPRVLFDEYALGTWQPGTAVAMLASPRLFLATIHALVLLGLVVLAAAWARDFPRDPLTQRTTSPLLRARGLGGLLVRAKRFDVLSKFLLEGAARGLDRRDPKAASALRERAATPARSAIDLQALAAEVRAIERAAG
jgi:hypothetical protein